MGLGTSPRCIADAVGCFLFLVEKGDPAASLEPTTDPFYRDSIYQRRLSQSHTPA